MDILDTEKYFYQIRFIIDEESSDKKDKENWKKLKEKCESGNNEFIFERIKEYFKMESNKNLPYLNRMEGGIGGNNNVINKQIRFRSDLIKNNDNDIIFDNICNGENEKWTYDEIDDFIFSFIKHINYWFHSNNIVEGRIEMINKKFLDDNIFDDDDEY